MTQAANAHQIRIGPSGWSYPDWKGIVYPTGGGSRFDALGYLSSFFDAIEVNTSFYRPPARDMTRSWVRRVAHRPDFRFALKLWQRFTHELSPAGDRSELELDAGDVDQFKKGLDPVVEAGILGCVLLQFPWSFRNNEQAVDWLERLAQTFGEYPLVVELRHASWDTPETRDRLRRMRINYCNIDQPRLNQCLGPSDHATGPVGYVRFHGRRYDTWFADNVRPSARYDYLYREDELKEWLSRIETVASQTESLYIFANNHYRGQGPANALQLRAMVEQRKIDVPPDLLPHFPFLRDLAKDTVAPQSGQQSLFDM